MPYLVQPPAQSIDAYNPLLTYTLADPLPAEISILQDLQKWGWQISVHFEDEEIYIDAARETEKAIKKMGRRTQMIYGDVVGDSPRLTLEEMWQREATKKEEERQYDTKEKEEVNDAASMMSRMTEQRAWVRWANEEAGLEPESPNVDKTTDEQSYLSHALSLEDYEDSVIDVYEGPAGSPKAPVGLMGMSGYWCPPIFQARPQKNPQSQSVAPSAVFPSRDWKEARKLKKKVTRRDSEPSVGKYLPLGFVRPPSWVKGKRSANEGASADATAPDEQQTTVRSESSFSPYQRTTPTQSVSNIHLQEYSSTFLQPVLRNISPAFSSTSSLIFPGREITPEAYFQRTNRPRKNLQPRQLTPPPGLESDPYMWQVWDRGRKRQQDKTDRVLGKDSIHRSDSGNASWYDGFQTMMKEEEAKVTKEEKKAEKKARKVKKKDEKEERIRKENREKEERIRKENEVREALRKKGDFADILRDLIITTEGQAEEPYSYHEWGYTIYRTCYTPESESQWESLTKAIQQGVEKSLSESQNDEPPTTFQLLRSLLRLDFRSDASLYDSLTIDQLRQTYVNPPEDSVPSPNFYKSERLFLVADAEVLLDPYFLPKENETTNVPVDNNTSDVATTQSVQKWQYQYHGYSKSSGTKRRWLKCVEVDYVAADHHPRRRGQGPRPYFGWFMVTAESVMELWEVLLDQDVEEIKPRLVDVMIWGGY
ncbi:hypothetical protein J4E86_009933 [Alternaria arbusti]|uniref:uncharacterized protein n=1 Tax=Alternaria arbusti TaxID=232088 RepID=UPI00221ED87A|nr:uncharacterized protein J4E86_009933 [Alternaria arbusti]KAI4942986.1 hypothetical protein J4E86_009933 [Alternaria arbusti]